MFPSDPGASVSAQRLPLNASEQEEELCIAVCSVLLAQVCNLPNKIGPWLVLCCCEESHFKPQPVQVEDASRIVWGIHILPLASQCQ